MSDADLKTDGKNGVMKLGDRTPHFDFLLQPRIRKCSVLPVLTDGEMKRA